MTEQTAPKADPVVTTVTMEDGRVVDFVGKRKIQKASEIVNGQVVTTIDFVNGRTVRFVMPQELLGQFAAHGAEQKLGDAAAGEKDIDDAVEAVAETAARLARGEWNVKRESSGGSGGASILVKALCEHSGKSVEQIRQFLSTKTQAQKMAMRQSAQIKPIIDRLEAEKQAKKGGSVNTEELFAGL